jgi:peptidylprolyl isomerase
MKKRILLFWLAGSLAVQAQTQPRPAAPKASSAPSTAAHPAAGIQLPPGVPKVAAPLTTAFSLKYQEIKVGSGAEAVPFKVYKVFYTGYRASDGVKFDSSDDHRNPIMGKDGKPELGPDGKPKLGDPEPLAFPQGMGRLIPGFDQGLVGMHVGGKRRLFIPYQLAYGTRTIPDQQAKEGQPGHVGIPAKSDLIFDVELVDVSEMPPQMQRPPMGAGAPAPKPAAPAGQGAPAESAAPATPPPSSQPSQPAQPTPPPQPQQ